MSKFIERALSFWFGFLIGYLMFRYAFNLGHLAAAFAYVSAQVSFYGYRLCDKAGA